MSVVRRVLFPFAKRFVAGETVDSAITRAERLNDDGITALIDHLGEHVEERTVAEDAVAEYERLIARIDGEEVDADLSVKLTHLGLEIDAGFCRENVSQLLDAAAEHGVFVWIDMESSAHTDETITLFEELHVDHDNVGICIQAYLKRSAKDVDRLLGSDAVIRLVKGAYNESTDIAYRDRDRVAANYEVIVQRLFEHGTHFAVATHDTDLIEYALELADRYDHHDMEFQFLMGVYDELPKELAADGHDVAEYVPYGAEWLSYYWRRIRERRENLRFALEAVVRSALP